MSLTAFHAALRELPEATDEQIAALAEEHGITLTETPEPDTGSGETPEETADGNGGDTPPATPPAPPTPDTEPGETPEASAADTVTVPREAWESVQEGAQAGARAEAKAEENLRDSTIKLATAKGKISPHQKQSMLNLHEKNRTAFYTLLTETPDKGGLAENIVPVDPGGIGGDGPAAAAEVSDEFMAQAFPGSVDTRSAA